MARWAERARMAKYKAGWDWAAGRLLEGAVFDEVRGRACVLMFDDWNDGIADACRAWSVSAPIAGWTASAPIPHGAEFKRDGAVYRHEGQS